MGASFDARVDDIRPYIDLVIAGITKNNSQISTLRVKLKELHEDSQVEEEQTERLDNGDGTVTVSTRVPRKEWDVELLVFRDSLR